MAQYKGHKLFRRGATWYIELPARGTGGGFRLGFSSKAKAQAYVDRLET